MSKTKDDSFGQFDELLKPQAVLNATPWAGGVYLPDLDMLRELLSIPISQGERQESGRPAKALDAWIASELRRSGFPADAVWPRLRRPRVLAEGLGEIERLIDNLGAQLAAAEADGKRLRPTDLRRAIRDVESGLPGAHDAYILGDFYAKQIDVGMSSWQRGPDLLISTKTMFSSYGKNLKNRHEEAVGEVSSLRRRHPMATMGYVYLVRKNVYDEPGAYASLYDILSRLRRPGETFDATMLLVAEWSDTEPQPVVTNIAEPAPELSAARFFTDLVKYVTARTPISEHQAVRLRRDGQPIGGLPDSDSFDLDDGDELGVDSDG
ncbi:hypothetical protein [Mycobacteroides abscessus]|uniref:hypothetical protein n=1 Tax=Mycobacteroides abscessus TaxID=36809 RepID=UPI000C264906|nr:hypothetical protein [Mycobacteroides abscessus]